MNAEKRKLIQFFAGYMEGYDDAKAGRTGSQNTTYPSASEDWQSGYRDGFDAAKEGRSGDRSRGKVSMAVS